MSTYVIYEAVPTQIIDGAEKTILGDDIGRPRVVVDAVPPPVVGGTIELSSGWTLDYGNGSLDVPGFVQYLSVRTQVSGTPPTIYALIFDTTSGAPPVLGDLAVETLGPLVENDYDWWEPLNGGWELVNGLYVVASTTPVQYTPFGVPPGNVVAYTVRYLPA